MFMYFLGFNSRSTRQDFSLPEGISKENPEDLVRLEPGTFRLQFIHFTTEPHRAPINWLRPLENAATIKFKQY